jgi:hypothetical protein
MSQARKSQGRTSAGSCDARCESSWQSRAGRSTTGTDLPVRAICAAAQSGCINCRTKADQSADPKWQITHLEHMVWAHMRARPRESKRDRSCRRQRARGSAGDVRMSESDWGMARGYKSRALSCRVSKSVPRVRTARATSRKFASPSKCKDPVTAEGPASLIPERRALVVRVSAAGRESKHTRNVAYYHCKLGRSIARSIAYEVHNQAFVRGHPPHVERAPSAPCQQRTRCARSSQIRIQSL